MMKLDGPVRTLTKPLLLAWVARRDAAAAKRLIAMQIQATPNRVAGPIDVFTN